MDQNIPTLPPIRVRIRPTLPYPGATMPPPHAQTQWLPQAQHHRPRALTAAHTAGPPCGSATCLSLALFPCTYRQRHFRIEIAAMPLDPLSRSYPLASMPLQPAPPKQIALQWQRDGAAGLAWPHAGVRCSGRHCEPRGWQAALHGTSGLVGSAGEQALHGGVVRPRSWWG